MLVIRGWKMQLDKLFYVLIYPLICLAKLGDLDQRRLLDNLSQSTKQSGLNRLVASSFDLSALKNVDLTQYGM